MGPDPRTVWRKAVSDFKTWVAQGRRYVIGFILQTAGLFGILYFQPWVGNLPDESKLVGASVAAVFLSALLRFLWSLATAPEAIWREQRTQIADFTKRLTPMLKANPINGGKPVRWNRGSVNRSGHTGKAQTVITASVEYLGIECANDTDTHIQNAQAYLVSLKREGGEDTVFVESVDLHWLMVGDSPDHFTQFPPGGRRKLVVAAVMQDQAIISSTRVPIEYQTIFDVGGDFIGRIIVTAYAGGATAIDFRIVQGDGRPRLELLSEPKGIDFDSLQTLDQEYGGELPAR